MLAALLMAVVVASAQVVPDVAREKRHAEQVLASLVVGDAVWLASPAQPRFLGLLTEPPQPKGAVLLLHGPGWHPDHGLDLPAFAVPVLDMYGAEDYRGIRWPAVLRKRTLDRTPGSKQVAIAEGGWFLDGGHAAVLRETAAFLDAARR